MKYRVHTRTIVCGTSPIFKVYLKSIILIPRVVRATDFIFLVFNKTIQPINSLRLLTWTMSKKKKKTISLLVTLQILLALKSNKNHNDIKYFAKARSCYESLRRSFLWPWRRPNRNVVWTTEMKSMFRALPGMVLTNSKRTNWGLRFMYSAALY